MGSYASVDSKVIIEKSHGNVSLVEQDTIENVKKINLILCIFLVQTLECLWIPIKT